MTDQLEEYEKFNTDYENGVYDEDKNENEDDETEEETRETEEVNGSDDDNDLSDLHMKLWTRIPTMRQMKVIPTLKKY